MSAKNEWWTTVLGEYPTGVALITSANSEGQPVGMVVGTFCAVSQEPPLIGFLPDVSSSTFPQIRENGRLSVSIMGTRHEALVRAFAAKHPERWDHGEWTTGANAIKRPGDALVWFEAVIETVVPAGDHFMVVAAVDDFGVGSGDPGLPMLFLRGGYGTFAVDVAPESPGALHAQLALTQRIRPEISRLAAELDAEVIVSAVDRDRIVVLDAFDGPTATSDEKHLRVSFPLAAPLAPAFVSWGSHARRTAWTEQSRHLVGQVDRTLLSELIEITERRGFAVTGGPETDTRFSTVISKEMPPRSELKSLWSQAMDDARELVADPRHLPQRITSIQAPVFDADGEVALVVTINREFDRSDVDAIGAHLVQLCSDLGDGAH